MSMRRIRMSVMLTRLQMATKYGWDIIDLYRRSDDWAWYTIDELYWQMIAIYSDDDIAI